MEMEKENNKIQVIIAHPIPEERQSIADAFEQSGRFCVCYTTHDGLECLREVAARQPELVLIHGVLDQIDGLELLQRLEKLSLPKTKRIYLTNYSNYLSEHAALASADHCVLLPCMNKVLVRLAEELVLPPQLAASDGEIRVHAANILRRLNAPENHKGYRYAMDAIRILVRDPGLVARRQVTTRLYGTIAQINQLPNSLQVERCLRTLTQHIFMINNSNTLEQFFSPALIQKGKLTNTVFLSSVARYVTDALTEERSGAGSDDDINERV